MLKILVLGASGMLGHKVFEVLSSNEQYDVYGTVTKMTSFKNKLPTKFFNKIIEGIYADKIDTVESLLLKQKPDVVINCIGIIKQNGDSKNTKNCIVLNALFPQQVAEICEQINCRFITIATDCVFDGQKALLI
jgi:dTDP-4-dehydrorhamnose reductase